MAGVAQTPPLLSIFKEPNKPEPKHRAQTPVKNTQARHARKRRGGLYINITISRGVLPESTW